MSGAMPSGRKWSNVVHCKFTGAAGQPTDTDIAALDLKLVRLWSGAAYSSGSSWLVMCIASVTLTQSTYYVLDGSSPATVVARSGVGGAVGSSAPGECACVLTLRTNKRGRRYRGRIYLPAPAATSTTSNGGVSGATISSILAQFDGLISDLATINWQLGVATYGHSIDKHGVETTWPPDFTPVAAGIKGRSMDALYDVQRHRKG